MPWTGPQFGLKNSHLSPPQAAHAARIANAILARGAPESVAIATANKHFMHRDVGGGVDPQGGIGGIAPSAQAQNPLQQGMIQQYASLPTEKLQEMAARAGGSPQGQIIRAILQRKLTQPNAQPQAPQQPQQLIGAAPPAMSTGGHMPHYAAGGPAMIMPPMGRGAPVSSAPIGTGPSGFTSEDIGPVGRAALTAAGLVPGPIGAIAGIASLGLKGNNVAALNQNLSQVGQPALSAGQTAGAFAPFGNIYGSGNLPGSLNNLGYASSGIPASAVSGGQAGMGPAGPPGGGIGQSNGGGGEYARGGPMLRRAAGGDMGISPGEATPWWVRSEARSADTGGGGFLAGTTGGRTDAIKTTAPAGAYVLPADVISGLGEGNTLAGAKVWQSILQSGPYGTPQARGARGMGAPRPPPVYREGQGFKAGGTPGEFGEHQPVALSDGEQVVAPADVLWFGKQRFRRDSKGKKSVPMPSTKELMKLGWRELDEFVVEERAKNVKRLAKLPGPVGARKNAA